MSADVFYCPPADFAAHPLVIGGDEFNHLAHVMRKKAGDAIVVVDGLGNARQALIQSLGRRAALCSAGPVMANHREPALRVTLAAAVLKNPSRYDYLVEKATELGVDAIVPMATARTIPSHAKSDRWRKLALAAMKQCGRSWWPPVRDLTMFPAMLGEFAAWETKIVAHEDPSAGKAHREGASRSASGGVSASEGGGSSRERRQTLLLIGPEGGFTPEEVEECIARGFSTLYLGDRRLRAETAAAAALSRLLAWE